jgi:ribosome-binding factor A
MPSFKIGRATADIQRELSDLFRELKDPRVSKLLSIVKIDLSNDLSYATVYVSAIEGFDKTVESVKGLKSAAGFLRRELGLREEAVEDLMMLSEESLNSSIKTFMEFKESNTFNVNKLPKINSEALVSAEQDNTVKEVTESANNKNMSNIDFENDIEDWFKKMTHRKYFN